MAIANTLQGTVNWCSTFARLSPLIGVGGLTNEPSLTIGNWVRGFILSPPFAWRWNRKVISFTTTAGTQDYTQSLPDFGWIEKSSANDGSNIYELEVKMSLGEDSQQNQPRTIAALLDDNSGNITFRLLPNPNTIYTVTVQYQKASPNFVSLGDTWSPIPDFFSYLYNQGCLAKVYEYMDDPRFGFATQLFMKQLIAANAGLDETQVNIFLAERIDSTRQEQTHLGRSQLGTQGRGGY